MATPRRTPKFFITHSSKDAIFAKRLADDLHKHGLDGFVDLYSILPGDNFVKGIDLGLRKCDVFIPIVSFEALKSPWCITEITAAIALSNQRRRKGRPRIIPVLIEDCRKALPVLLHVLNWIDFAGRYGKALKELLERGFGLVHTGPFAEAVAIAPSPNPIQINLITIVIRQTERGSEKIDFPSSQTVATTESSILVKFGQRQKIQITSTIGEGGAATVYKGISLANRAPVAIKVLKTTANPTLFKKFIAEGKIGMSLTHPHIARIYNYGEEDGTYFIVMEYVDGGSLRRRLTPHKPCSIDFTIATIGQTCEALSYFHKKKIIHRDMKPENILLSSHGGVKVVDFGIAKFTSATSKTADGIIMGTPYYMSYEQASGNPVVPASDIYSLGMILYEMVTGEWPFTGDALSVIHKHLTQKPISPRQINPDIPRQVESAVMRALEKDIGKRYQDAMELARDIGYEPGTRINVFPEIGLDTLQFSDSIGPLLQAGDARLLPMKDGVVGKPFMLEQNKIVSFGRVDIDSNDSAISRQHFRVIGQAGEFWVEDAGSTNGTLVNSKLIEGRRILRTGDIINAGQTSLIFVR